MSELLTLTLVFSEREPALIQQIADNTADPDHPDYGRHLDRAELEELVILPDEERRQVTDWLAGHGMSIVESPETSRQLLFVRATTAQVEAAFGPEVTRWLRKDGDNRAARVASAMPRRLAGYVQKIGGLPGERGQAGTSLIGPLAADGETPDTSEARLTGAISVTAGMVGPPPELSGATPADIRGFYDFPDGWDGRGETIALMMLGGQLAEGDLHTFWRAHGITPPEVHTVQVGPADPRPPHPLHVLEAAMTVEWAGAMASGAKIVVYRIDPTVMGDPWAAFLFAIIGDKFHAPTIACTSWITPERRYYGQNGHGVVTGLLDQAAALGITVVSAAGDWGAFDGIPRTVRDGRHVSDAPWPHGVFPAVEERVLAVGGTMITHRHPLTEVAWSGPPPPGMQKAVCFERLAGSGGFSEDVPIPAWQKPLLRGHYPRGAGSPAVVPYGRGFPDVALMASGPAVQRGVGEPLTSQGYQAVANGQWLDYAGGTSVAAPIWAAIIALANQARRAAGLGRLGFAQPLLYGLHEAEPPPFREITAGAADVAMSVVNLHGRAVTYQLPGYECRAGWDPVTGLGVPRVAHLIRQVCRVREPRAL
jgi:kumamolisin